jgi:FkbM family methyltransferase
MNAIGPALQRRLKTFVSPRRGNLKALNITERGRTLSALCPDDEVFTLSRELILDRIYERRGVSLNADIGTVVDAGAHAGIFSLLASQWAKEVVAIEASRVNFDLLKLNIDRNGIDNIDARNRALWGKSGEMVQLEAMIASGSGRLKESEVNERCNEVETLSLDDLIDEIGDIDLLKIDIEGAEFEVLGACTKLSSISTIVGELHIENEGERYLLDTLVETLRNSGFNVSLVTETELYSRESLTRLQKNMGSLQGNHLTKAIAAAYYLAPIQKPIRPSGTTYELPILVAQRA